MAGIVRSARPCLWQKRKTFLAEMVEILAVKSETKQFANKGPKHVVGLSGGKDSTALAVRLMEVEPRDYEFVCTPTGNELPELFEHLTRLEQILGQSIRHIGSGKDLYNVIDEQKMIPNWRARFCTRILKIEPIIEYFESLHPDSVHYVGLRADEESRQGLYGEDITTRHPLREWGWGIDDVWRYLNGKGISVPDRTDCGVCFYQRLGEWWTLWKFHPEVFAQGEAVEEKYDYTFRSPQRDKQPTSLKMLRMKFENGYVPRGAAYQADMFGCAEKCRVCSL
jgi:3'-phosphoadenosine 5'-phosphosulfate sulfotransferase (PAPS reductase)/FAD synthetase